jgi:hypothetical protein
MAALCIAADFSGTIFEYAVGVRVPRAIDDTR